MSWALLNVTNFQVEVPTPHSLPQAWLLNFFKIQISLDPYSAATNIPRLQRYGYK